MIFESLCNSFLSISCHVVLCNSCVYLSTSYSEKFYRNLGMFQQVLTVDANQREESLNIKVQQKLMWAKILSKAMKEIREDMIYLDLPLIRAPEMESEDTLKLYTKSTWCVGALSSMMELINALRFHNKRTFRSNSDCLFVKFKVEPEQGQLYILYRPVYSEWKKEMLYSYRRQAKLLK